MYIFRRFGGRVKNILFRWSSNCSVSGASYYIGKIAVVRYVYSIYSLNFKPIHKFESPVAFYLFGIDSVGVLTESSSSASACPRYCLQSPRFNGHAQFFIHNNESLQRFVGFPTELKPSIFLCISS